MKTFPFSAVLYVLRLAIPITLGPEHMPIVRSDLLRNLISRADILKKSQTLEDFAYSTPERNRVFGSPGHNLTINWIHDSIKALGDYYDVDFQPFVELYAAGNASLKANGVDQAASLFQYAPSGAFSEEIVPVAKLGCNASDYSALVKGKIALISRGKCDFGLKSSLAGAAGADAAVIYDNTNGSTLGGTLGSPHRPEGPYVPTIGISLANGMAILDHINSGKIVLGDIIVNSIEENRTTYNVVAQSKCGDPDNVIVYTAHTDSVAAGPGINDNGSGTIALLHVAEQLAKFSVNNAIRFVWVSAEEFGLLGSTFYVNSLDEAERSKIRLNLNFDMLASPNYVYSVYDGDGSAFNFTGPPGSAEIKHLLEDYFKNYINTPLVPAAFDGRSDYGPFLDVGIATGGLATGDEELKTLEEQKLFGGEAGVAHDVNYHQAGDNFTNLNFDAFILNTKAIAHTVATLGKSLEGFPAKTLASPPSPMKKTIKMRHTVFDKYVLEQ